jgi:SHS2 domain-containing protein
MFGVEQSARAWFDFIYDNMVKAMIKGDIRDVEIYQGLLRDIKIMDENGQYKIDFKTPSSSTKMTNTSK